MDLQQRVERLESQNRSLRLVAFSIIVLGCGVALLGAQSRQSAQSSEAQPSQFNAAEDDSSIRRSKPNEEKSRKPRAKSSDSALDVNSSDSSFEVLDEGGRVQGIFVIIGSGNVMNLGGPNGRGPIWAGTGGPPRAKETDDPIPKTQPRKRRGKRVTLSVTASRLALMGSLTGQYPFLSTSALAFNKIECVLEQL